MHPQRSISCRRQSIIGIITAGGIYGNSRAIEFPEVPAPLRNLHCLILTPSARISGSISCRIRIEGVINSTAAQQKPVGGTGSCFNLKSFKQRTFIPLTSGNSNDFPHGQFIFRQNIAFFYTLNQSIELFFSGIFGMTFCQSCGNLFRRSGGNTAGSRTFPVQTIL